MRPVAAVKQDRLGARVALEICVIDLTPVLENVEFTFIHIFLKAGETINLIFLSSFCIA